MKRSATIELIAALLLLLFLYTAASKLLDFAQFKMQMRMQAVPAVLIPALIWLLPPAEILVALLLLFPRWRMTGLWLSAGFLSVFTLYVGLALLDVYPRRPCSCGGVLRQLGWTAHFWFNLFFLLLSIYAIVLDNRERRTALP